MGIGGVGGGHSSLIASKIKANNPATCGLKKPRNRRAKSDATQGGAAPHPSSVDYCDAVSPV